MRLAIVSSVLIALGYCSGAITLVTAIRSSGQGQGQTVAAAVPVASSSGWILSAAWATVWRGMASEWKLCSQQLCNRLNAHPPAFVCRRVTEEVCKCHISLLGPDCAPCMLSMAKITFYESLEITNKAVLTLSPARPFSH